MQIIVAHGSHKAYQKLLLIYIAINTFPKQW